MKPAIVFLVGLLCSGMLAEGSEYFVAQYNAVPNTGAPGQLKILGIWGYYTNTGGYLNDYVPSQGDEIGAFWHDGTNDILVGAAAVNAGAASDRAYSTLNVFGRDSDYPEGLSYGLTNGAWLSFRVYVTDRGAEYAAYPNMVFQGAEIFHQHDLASWHATGAAQSFWFRAVALTNSVVLRWADPAPCGLLDSNVHIRVSTESFPANLDLGEQLYQGGDQFVVHTNLTPGQICYYTIWCSNDGESYIEPP